MSRLPLPALFSVLFCSLVLEGPALAQGTMADEFARRQDFSTSPPTLGFSLNDMLEWSRPNRSYEHLTGPPFPGPRPFYLPQDLYSIFLRSKTSSYQTSSSPRCVKTEREFYVTMVFTDGSRYSFEDIEVTEVCSDGSKTSFRKRYQIPELGPPGNREWLIRVESWTSENLETRKHSVRGAGTATASFANRGGVPVITGGPLEIDMAPGGVLDLRQNAAAAGPLFTTTGPALVRCDQVLMDPGVQLSDLFSPPPIAMPAQLLFDWDFLTFGHVTARPGAPSAAPVIVANTGHVTEQFQIAWNGAFTTPGQAVVAVSAGELRQIDLPVSIPPGTPDGAVDIVQLQVTPLTRPTQAVSALLAVSSDHLGQFRYGAGSPGNNGLHTISADGPLVAGGPVVRISTVGADAGAIGLAMFGVPVNFQYGTWTIPGFPEFYVDPLGPVFLTVPLVADPSGVSTFSLQLLSAPGLRGLPLDYQSVHLYSSVQYPFRLSSSPALSLTVQ